MSPSILRLPYQALAYLSPKHRQDAQWTYRQALANAVLKSGLEIYTGLRINPSLSLKPGHEKRRFVLIEPGNPLLYAGAAHDDKIKPETIGATWYPDTYHVRDYDRADCEYVMLYLHGGSYVLGNGRTLTCRYLTTTLLQNTPCCYILSVQYRLACNKNGRFPAQLQDAITAYSYLVHTLRIPASRIVLSGDSSGAHLALALLRHIAYLKEFHGRKEDDHVSINKALLPPPKCTWAFSPWCDVPAARDPNCWTSSPRFKSEYIPGSFPAWGAQKFLDDLEITEFIEQYVAPIKHPFLLPSPVLVVTGGREVLCEEHKELVQSYRSLPRNESRIEVFVEENVPHDVLMIAWIMNFHGEARTCACQAGKFLLRRETRETNE
ncbi:hypothetical protein UA08_03372 [Talaromyces atroroseus]|uniref:Alpha/beta hydrolase fold-3 domain-containing protein n=1 Tax=Talaromyces atroroseus TaxID=1441469 RepID=A0A225AI69_TALAT|nr:hypothetical protein UA08_03372 [Talaromyces atroroseus]OKL61141.1 hypothetical protein UA08_03372 [Talaromyces atroroseus]